MTQSLRLLEVYRPFERAFRIVALTSEYQLVCSMLEEQWLPRSQLHAHSRLSSGDLKDMMAKLVVRGDLVRRLSPGYVRRAEYQLTQEMRELAIERHTDYLKLTMSARAGVRGDEVSLTAYQTFLLKARPASHLTAEFQILLYLYIAVQLENDALAHFINALPASLKQTLGKLHAYGLVAVTPNPDSKRTKLWGLPQPVRAALDRLHDRVGEWLSAANA
jgi:DNA-binding MarR family transcriptional regulator/DNA-binding HxlR family transcriptional regulator